MDNETLARKESAMITLLESINKDNPLPSQRLENRDWAWFGRNLGINHGGHPLFSTVSSLLKDILREKRLRRLENV